jgi:hypothetical protein
LRNQNRRLRRKFEAAPRPSLDALQGGEETRIGLALSQLDVVKRKARNKAVPDRR